jgi:uncharacterized protein (UPF0261 family)
MPTAVLIGTLDTKGREYAFVRDLLVGHGLHVITVDVGVLGPPEFTPDIGSDLVAQAAGHTLTSLQFGREGTDTRGVALQAMRDGATAIVQRLVEQGRCDGLMGLGGSGGSTVLSGPMRSLPFGLPKLLVSTMASGDVSGYVGSSDLCLMHSVTDIAGLNRISRPILTNAAAAFAGMITARAVAHDMDGPRSDDRPAVGITMLGITTPGALRVVSRLEAAGFDPIVFHAVGSGGRAMESLVSAGVITGVVDYTIKEVTDTLLGGAFDAGPERLTTAGRLGYPQVVVPGAMEVLNFGPLSSVPLRLRDGSRPLVQHNEQVTAVRISAAESEQVAAEIAQRLNRSTGPVIVVIPRHGLDSYDTVGGPFFDAEADAMMIRALKAELRGDIEVVTCDNEINDPAFADLVADTFISLARAT